MSHLVSRLLSIAITRQDDRELEYQVGDPYVSEGLWFWPPWTDPLPTLMDTWPVNGPSLVTSIQPMYDDRIRYGGFSNFPYRITGIVVDSTSTPVSNAVCSLFRTSDDQWMYDCVSKDGGQYDFGVSDTTTTYYVVAFDTGNGRQGVTTNTLVGS